MTRTSKAWTVANALFALMFGFSVVVQVNDPDPLGWVAVYGLAVLVCVLVIVRRVHPVVPVLVALAALTWAATIAPRVLGRVEFLGMFGAFEMESLAVEESREMYGLLLVAAWMGVVAFRSRR